VAFGYDADLAQVRAEFDGEMLRVIVPRKAVWNPAQSGWTSCSTTNSLLGYSGSLRNGL